MAPSLSRRWALLRQLLAAVRDPARLDEVPALKSELGGTRASPEIEAQLDAVRGHHPTLSLDALLALPPTSFGHATGAFLRDQGLAPLGVSPDLDPELVARNAFVLRYGAIHDMIHVLLGFDASWPGEIGVWAFVGAQRWSPTFRVAAVAALLVAPLRCPLRLGAAWRAFQRGRALAAGAPPLITLRLEDHLARELSAVRAELGLAAAGGAG